MKGSLATALVVVAAVGMTCPPGGSAVPCASEVAAPAITYLDPPDEDVIVTIEWALDRYVQAGLQLPDVEISFPVACGGKAGLYRVGRGHIELCRPSRKLVLHELAHAWEDADRVDRDAFMARRGVEHWYDDETCSGVPGGEQLARIVTWGLMDVDTTVPAFATTPGQPLEERPRHLPGLEDSAPETLAREFDLLTGRRPLVEWTGVALGA